MPSPFPREPHAPMRWRWLTNEEREMSHEGRRVKCARWWVPVSHKACPTGRRDAPSVWYIEVQLVNGQSVFYRAY